MASSKEEFAEIIGEIRKLVASDEHAECSCTNIRCELHGDCYNCVRAYRHFGHHIPRCLQFILDKKVANISRTIEYEMGKKPETPDEYYDYRDSVMLEK